MGPFLLVSLDGLCFYLANPFGIFVVVLLFFPYIAPVILYFIDFGGVLMSMFFPLFSVEFPCVLFKGLVLVEKLLSLFEPFLLVELLLVVVSVFR